MMNTNRHSLPRSCALTAYLAILSTCTSTRPVWADDNVAGIDPAYPVGSVTYFIIASTDSDGGAPSVDIVQATKQTCREVTEALYKLRRQARDTKDGETLPSVSIQCFTVTVWSDGKLEHTTPSPVNESTLTRIVDRLDTEEESTRRKQVKLPALPPAGGRAATPKNEERRMQPNAPSNKKEDANARTVSNTTTGSAGDQCHARTDNGKRCSRTAKGATGFCWQHQQHPDAYPTK